MSFAIKGADLLCLTESLFSTSSDNSVGAVEAEPQAEGMWSGEESGIVTEGPSRVVYWAVVGETSCLLSLTTSVLVSKEPKGLSALKSFGTKCIPGNRSLETILGKIIGVKRSRFENTFWRLVLISKREKLLCLKSMLNILVSRSREGFSTPSTRRLRHFLVVWKQD